MENVQVAATNCAGPNCDASILNQQAETGAEFANTNYNGCAQTTNKPMLTFRVPSNTGYYRIYYLDSSEENRPYVWTVKSCFDGDCVIMEHSMQRTTAFSDSSPLKMSKRFALDDGEVFVSITDGENSETYTVYFGKNFVSTITGTSGSLYHDGVRVAAVMSDSHNTPHAVRVMANKWSPPGPCAVQYEGNFQIVATCDSASPTHSPTFSPSTPPSTTEPTPSPTPLPSKMPTGPAFEVTITFLQTLGCAKGEEQIGMQISELNFYDSGKNRLNIIDISAPGAQLFTGGEGIQMVTDDKRGTKFLTKTMNCTAGAAPSQQSPQVVIVTVPGNAFTYNFKTGADSHSYPGRTPSKWRVEFRKANGEDTTFVHMQNEPLGRFEESPMFSLITQDINVKVHNVGNRVVQIRNLLNGDVLMVPSDGNYQMSLDLAMDDAYEMSVLPAECYVHGGDTGTFTGGMINVEVTCGYCPNFHMGNCACDYETLGLDIIIVEDSSNTIPDVEFTNMKNAIANELESRWPEVGRLGIIQFASLQRLVANYSETFTAAEAAARARTLSATDSLGSFTNMQHAISTAYDKIIAPDIASNPLNEHRQNYFIMITDGEPTEGQEPCEDGVPKGNNQKLIDMYDMHIVALQDKYVAPALDCLDWNKYLMSDWTESEQKVKEIFDHIEAQCTYTSTNPYNGGYSEVALDASGNPIFLNGGAQHEARLNSDGNWVFSDRTGALTPMVEDQAMGYRMPLMGANFTSDGASYDTTAICCAKTAAPTRSPSAAPTTTTPTYKPSTTPTTSEPSSEPTPSPTNEPSPSPSEAPTTTTPSRGPTTTEPSSEPTPSPTNEPSPSPTTSVPSQSPTTTIPSSSPTTSLPSPSPTDTPTFAPTSCNDRLLQVQQECTTSITTLQNQTQILINEIESLTSCTKLQETVENLQGLLESQQASSWQRAVDSGLPCDAVPVDICFNDEITLCKIEDKTVKRHLQACVEKTSRTPPEVNNCADDTQAWIDAVEKNHITCNFVPIDVCGSGKMQCAVDGAACIRD